MLWFDFALRDCGVFHTLLETVPREILTHIIRSVSVFVLIIMIIIACCFLYPVMNVPIARILHASF